jgi:hypothetical protein
MWAQYRRPFAELPSTHDRLLLEAGQVAQMVD